MAIKPMKITLDAYAVQVKTVTPYGEGARISLPKKWANKKVRIFLVEPLDEDEGAE